MSSVMFALAEGWHGGPWGHGWHGATGGGWWWIAWPIGWTVFLALLGVGVWLIIRATARNRPATMAYAPSPTENARRILGERFARGEIDEEEYRNRLGELS